MIPFNKPYFSGKETQYIEEAVKNGKISGNGDFTKKCHSFFEERYKFKKCLLTTSCTDALEMAAILINIQPGDEVIVPSYTFVSSALAFVRQGAKIIFADSYENNPNIDANKIESLITSKTKAIVPVHYAGVACDMDKIMEIANKHSLFVIEDAAQAIDSFHISYKDGKKRALGSIGHLGCFSFHETKNVIAGEGGMLTINDEQFINRSEIIWEKGTNRAEFFRGEVNKYGWVDIGSSFLPTEIVAAFLYAQLENIHEIQDKRKLLWTAYYENLNSHIDKGFYKLPKSAIYSTENGHMFYLICNSHEVRNSLINFLKGRGILTVFHYLSLHKSPYYINQHDERDLPQSDMFSDCLLRLPMYYELSLNEVTTISNEILSFFKLNTRATLVS
jgi:dTDP-4-amino-4,6-dideoxygalactose transaminase